MCVDNEKGVRLLTKTYFIVFLLFFQLSEQTFITILRDKCYDFNGKDTTIDFQAAQRLSGRAAEPAEPGLKTMMEGPHSRPWFLFWLANRSSYRVFFLFSLGTQSSEAIYTRPLYKSTGSLKPCTGLPGGLWSQLRTCTENSLLLDVVVVTGICTSWPIRQQISEGVKRCDISVWWIHAN